MIDRLRLFLRGIAVTAASMAVFAVSLGCFVALMLLVISMEEGGDNLSSYSMSLTSAMVLLAQGSGFRTGPVVLTLVPLSLTILLVLLIRAFAQRITCTMPGYVTGVLTWIMLDVFFERGTNAVLVDPLWLILVKGATVFTIGYMSAAIPASRFVADIIDHIRHAIGQSLRHAIRMGLTLGIALVMSYVVIGVITVFVWIVRNHMSVVRLYELLGMGNGSRILTTIACLAWLPNLCIWAVAWVFGSGFSIGDIATFTLWTGQSASLPSIPVLGVLPEPVANDRIRLALISIPLIFGLFSGIVAMLARRGFGIRITKNATYEDSRRLILEFAFPAGSFCVTCIVISVAIPMLFLLSNGGLGKERLSHLGVDVMLATQSVARPTSLGLMSSWLVTLIGVLCVFGIRWTVRRFRFRTSRGSSVRSNVPMPDRIAKGSVDADTAADMTGNVPGTGQQNAKATTKEEHR